MSPVSLGAIGVPCPHCGGEVRCPVVMVDHDLFDARLELHVPDHTCPPDGDDGERVAA